MKKKKKTKRVRAYADIGSHGGIFYFDLGVIAEKYPYLMHIYHKKISEDLKPVIIEYNF